MGYQKWRADRMFALAPAQAFVARWISTFEDYPPRQKPGSFNLSSAMEKLTSNPGSN